MKFTYYTIIGKDLNLFKGHVENVKQYAGFDNLSCDKEFLTIVYRNNSIPKNVTNNILDYCNEQDIRYYIYDEPLNESFLNNLYRCWNLGYQQATGELIFRGGSDQVYSKDSFIHLYNNYIEQAKKEEKIILQANTIENLDMILQIGANSRHLLSRLGNNFTEFNYSLFEKVVNQLNKDVPNPLLTIHECLQYWDRPRDFVTSLGTVRRCDGCSWLMTKKDFDLYGPLNPLENGYTGDVIIHDKLQIAGYKDYMVRDCVTYHFVRGESKLVYG